VKCSVGTPVEGRLAVKNQAEHFDNLLRILHDKHR